MKILLVEDEAIFQNLFKLHLRKLGFESIKIAESGEQAILLAKEYSPEIVFLDINLPTEIDGIDAAKEIQKNSPETHLIFVSANEDNYTMERIADIENLGFIHKPYNPELIGQYLKMVSIRVKKTQKNRLIA